MSQDKRDFYTYARHLPCGNSDFSASDVQKSNIFCHVESEKEGLRPIIYSVKDASCVNWSMFVQPLTEIHTDAQSPFVRVRLHQFLEPWAALGASQGHKNSQGTLHYPSSGSRNH